ncbi:hypothetical protein MKZ07_29840 [Paenibacillus sp. FSL P4-0338]|uniref:hypothetical protein n=1 Tax=Paenibacillus sp. FSL P4-0338 TaxID=2921635 RepID=UPI0003E1BF16|nr:hypothetical protein [Paenibacillus sp. FSL R7-269]ETT45537.1 hypothetical protein C162_20731 [Paenibacillus sp. FSL R7-269]
MLKQALHTGFTADYVLMDSWFTQAPLLRELAAQGLPVIGMVKEMKRRYLGQGKRLTLREVFQSLPASRAKDIKGSVIVQTACGLPIKLVFVRNRNEKWEWLAILSTDVTLDAVEIVGFYGMFRFKQYGNSEATEKLTFPGKVTIISQKDDIHSFLPNGCRLFLVIINFRLLQEPKGNIILGRGGALLCLRFSRRYE